MALYLHRHVMALTMGTMKRYDNYLTIIIFAVLALLFAAPAGIAFAENNSALPIVSGDIMRDTARVTFEWPKQVNFTADAHGKTVKITFDRNADPDFGPLLSTLYPYVTSAQTNSDGKTIVLTMDKAYKIRTFVADNIGGIDILDIDPLARDALSQTPSEAQLAALQAEIAAEAKSFARLAPAEGPPENKPAAPAPAKPEAATAPATPPSPAATATPATPATTEPAAATPAPPTAEVPKPTPEEQAATDAAHPQVLKINISATKDSAVIRLPFAERTAVAVFIRNNYLWIVTNKSLSLDLSDFDSLSKTVIGKAEPMEGHSMVLRIPLDDNIFASVAKEESSFEWAILLTQVKHNPVNPLKIDVNTDPPAPPNVFIGSLQMGDPVTLKDPVIGDELIVTPLFTLGEGVAVNREFVEFSVIPTAQGVAVAEKADDVSVVPLRNGLRVSLPQGTTLTSGLPPVEPASTTESLESIPTLFPYEKWKLTGPAPSRTQLRILFQKIIENTNHREANEQRIRMAQIYLSQGLAAEAIGILGGIDRTDPIYYRSAKLAALHGAAEFLMYRFSDAARDFAAPELNNNKEIEFWRSVLADLVGNPSKYDYLDMEPDYISKYPPLFRQRLAIVAADQAIDNKDYNAALKIFDTLDDSDAQTDASKDAGKDTSKKDTKKVDLLTPIKPYVNYLLAKISTETGQAKEGLDTWDQLATDYSNPFLQTHAEFSRIIWGMNHDSLDKDHAIDRLEHLRLSWHGDAMELKILELLGNLYNDKKDYVDAMRVWDAGVSSFPSTPTAIEMARKMRETFLLMFNEETAALSASPMDELVLYYQYKNYAPTSNVGMEITDRLADRLVAIDLLDQAATLLDHQMRYDADKAQRSKIGAKIASIYLLAHEPTRALKALQDSVYGETPGALHLLRNRITAQALFALGEPERARKIIEHDDSLEAERIRLDIYWEKKDWPHVISTGEDILKLRKDVTAPITLDESDAVLKLALAYVFQNDTLQLQYLHDYFGPLMAKNPDKPVFDFVTAGDVTPNPANFDEVVKRLSETRSFIENYRARVQIAGIDTSPTVPPAPATAKP